MRPAGLSTGRVATVTRGRADAGPATVPALVAGAQGGVTGSDEAWTI